MTLKFWLKTIKLVSHNPYFNQCNTNYFYLDFVTKNLLTWLICHFVRRPEELSFLIAWFSKSCEILGNKKAPKLLCFEAIVFMLSCVSWELVVKNVVKLLFVRFTYRLVCLFNATNVCHVKET